MPAANVTISATFKKAPVYEYTDLTKEMFHLWTGIDGTAEIADPDQHSCDYIVNESTTMPYGNGSVLALQYADLSEYDILTIETTEGEPRLCLNRPTDTENTAYVNIPNNEEQAAKYIKSSANNKFVYDLKAIKTDYEYVHLNCIKAAGAWGSKVNVTSMKLAKLDEETPTLYAITVLENENGTVEADVEEAEEGETVTLTVTPAEGYMVDEASYSYTLEGAEEATVAEIAEPEEDNNATFTMPAADVTVNITFKAIEVEPETPTIAATLVHTATSYSEATAGTFTSNVDAETEHVNNSNFGGTWAGAAYAEFSTTTLPSGASITKATLTFTGIGESRRARDTQVLYANAGETLDYEAIAIGNANVDLAATVLQTVSFPQASSQSFDIDVTDALKAILAEQNYIIFKWTGNPGGGDVAGKASENAPTLVIEYIPGAPEIANWSFDENADDVVTVTTQGYARNIAENSDQITGLQPVTGWTPIAEQTAGDPGFTGGVFAYGSENLLNNKVAAPAAAPEDSESPSALGLSAVWEGIAQYTQEATLPAGDYKFTYTAYNGANTGAVKKNLFGFITEEGTEYLSDQSTFTEGEWNTYEVAFTLDAETKGNISVGFIGAGGSGAAPHLFVDNVTLEKVPGIELALIDLKKAIEAAEAKKATYGVGEGLFQYPESEIEPLAQAITTAQAAYDAAESKAAVEAATAAINGAVEAFAPAMTAPDPEKKYVLTLTTSEGSFELSTGDGVKIVAAEEGTPVTFVAQEGGTYAIFDGAKYVNYEGSNRWTTATTDEAYGWTIAAVEGGYSITGKNGLLGTNTSDGNAVNSPCYGDKNTGNGNYIWTIAEYVEPTEKTIEIAIERIVGQGYTAQTEVMDFTEGLEFLGAESVTWDMLRMVEADGTLSDKFSNGEGEYDGWFNKEGYAQVWGDNSFVCVKMSQAQWTEGQTYEICDMGTAEVGDNVTAHWALVANDKTVFYNFNITFIEYVEPEYKPEIAKTIEIEGIDLAGKPYAQNTVEEASKNRPAIKFDVNEICEALGVEDITTLKPYIVNVTTGNFVENTANIDGWRNAQGDAAAWAQATNGYCLKMNAPASGEFDYAAAHDDNFAEGNTYVAQWGLVKEGGEGATDQAVVLKVTIRFVSEDDWNAAVDTATGIDGIASDGKAKMNGKKYMENGRIVIYRDGKKFSTTGVELK